MAVKIKVMVFWVAASEGRGSIILRNTSIQPPHYMAQQPRKSGLHSWHLLLVPKTVSVC